MAQIEVTVNGRNYLVACDPGEEAHVVHLGRYLDQKVAALVSNFGQVGDAKLAIMAGLIIADELADTDRALSDMKAAAVPERPAVGRAAAYRTASERSAAEAVPPRQSPDEALLAQTLDELAQRIEGIAIALEQG